MGTMLVLALLMAQPASIDLSGYELTWSDEFEGTTLDPKKWDAPEMSRQGGTCLWDPSLVSVRDGNLVLSIRPISGDGPRYRAGAVRTQPDYDPTRTYFEQAYGYFEISARLPRHLEADTWFAFWIMAGEIVDGQTDSRKGTEIDILESFFCWDGRIGHAIHWGGYGETLNSAVIESSRQPEVADGQFHRYGLLWTEDEYVFTFNGRPIARTDAKGLGTRPGRVLSQGTCQAPGYLKLTVEAAPWSGKTHEWEPGEHRPDEVLVDWVRVYKAKE